MNASALKGKQGGAFAIGTCGADPSLSEIWFNVTLAFLGDETSEGEMAAWGTTITGTLNLNFKAAKAVADVMPAVDEDWSEKVGNNLVAGVNAFNSTTGIEEIIADSIKSGKAVKAILNGQVVIVKEGAVYNVLGAKLGAIK